MKLTHPAVFLFGAGATRGGLILREVPPPLDGDFFGIARQLQGHGTPLLTKRVLTDVWSLYSRVNGIGLEEFYRDIETREKIGSFAKAQHKPKDWKRRRRDLDELIRRTVIQTTCDTSKSPHTPLVSGGHRKLLKKLKANDTIITFNYDTVIEESFEDAKLWTPSGGYGAGVYGHNLDWARKWLKERGQSKCPASKLRLLKLHGSINWVLNINKHVRIKPRPYVVRTKNNKPTFDSVAILAPGWNKPIAKAPFKGLWRDARLRLQQAKSIVIIGYSLPETDLLARGLFAEVVRSRVAKRKLLAQLHVADPNTAVVQRLIDLFTPALGAFGQICKYNGIEDLAKRL